jgi:hypothetical protein
MIAEKPNQIQRMDECFYKVASQNGHGMYDVIRRENGSWICNCLDFHYSALEKHEIIRCKHIWAVELSLKIREHVQARVIEPITDIDGCIFCKSENIKKEGYATTSTGIFRSSTARIVENGSR